MGKKFKKTAKELQRLSSLYQSTNQQPIGVAPVSVTVAAPGANEEPAVGTLAAAHMQKHAIIRRDLITLLIVALLMLAALFALNYLVDNTIVGTWLTQVVGKII